MDFFTKYGPQSIFNQVITLCIASLAQTIVIITAGIDLSLGSLIILMNCMAATFMQPIIDIIGSNIAGCILTCVIIMIVGALCGLFNGYVIAYGRLQPIVVTIATGSIYIGVARYVRPTPGGIVIPEFSRVLTGRVFDYIPMSAIILVLSVLLIWLPYRKSRSGQALYAIGGNESAAYYSGIKIKRAKILAYVIAGLCAAICGLLLTAQTRSGDPTASNNFVNNSIAAAVIGGVSLKGGKGSYIGSIAGSFILSLILGLLIFWKISSYYQNMVQGAILIIALSLSLLTSFLRGKKKNSKKVLTDGDES
jgi:ribose transport system permease protein